MRWAAALLAASISTIVAPVAAQTDDGADDASSTSSSGTSTTSSATSTSSSTASSSQAPSPSRPRDDPPPPTPPPADGAPHHDDEEEEDGGDPYDFLWVELQAGVSYVNMRAISNNNYYPTLVRLDGVGPMGALAAGFRISFFSAGLRGTIAHYSDDFDVGTVAAEAQLAIPLPIVKPFLRAGFGFAWHGDSNYNAPAMSQTTVFGWVFDAAAGLDIYLVEWFAIGAACSVDILNMSRQTIDEPMSSPTDVNLSEPGDAVGIQVRGSAGISFHL
ncbi:MAG: hypothetical protein AB7S26_19930 [Sandaracinaceae bacterium]